MDTVCPLGGSGFLHKRGLFPLMKRMASGTHTLVWTENRCVSAVLRVCSADFSCDKFINKHNPTLEPVMHKPDNVWETNCLMID